MDNPLRHRANTAATAPRPDSTEHHHLTRVVTALLPRNLLPVNTADMDSHLRSSTLRREDTTRLRTSHMAVIHHNPPTSRATERLQAALRNRAMGLLHRNGEVLLLLLL